MTTLYTWAAVLAVCGTFSLIGWLCLRSIDGLLDSAYRPFDWEKEGGL